MTIEEQLQEDNKRLRERAAAMVTMLEAELNKWRALLAVVPVYGEEREKNPGKALVTEISKTAGRMPALQALEFVMARGKNAKNAQTAITQLVNAKRLKEDGDDYVLGQEWDRKWEKRG